MRSMILHYLDHIAIIIYVGFCIILTYFLRVSSHPSKVCFNTIVFLVFFKVKFLINHLILHFFICFRIRLFSNVELLIDYLDRLF